MTSQHVEMVRHATHRMYATMGSAFVFQIAKAGSVVRMAVAGFAEIAHKGTRATASRLLVEHSLSNE